ncbi:hypothetical protein HPHPA11_0033 [Helicobacter pylori Hp A-11]|uniref:Uncharacterized protein n=1 Tax=Helicobacter pylori Hp A-11 TaxID=992035 RepID=N4TI24_HELPX|nr:hypothetical protein HPHPA11_0033 [Helicobacter pylori Hp A-11]
MLRKLKGGIKNYLNTQKRLTENNLLNPYILKTMFSVSPFPSLALAFCLVGYSFYF